MDRSKTTYAAIAIVVCWLTACGLPIDARLGIGVVAIGGAALSIVLFPALFRRLFTPSIRLIAIGLVAAAVMVVATYVLYPILAHVAPFIETSTRDLYVDKLRVPHANALVLIIVSLIVVGEEVLWRGVVQEAFGKRRLTVPLAAIVYGLAHAPLGSPLLVVVAVLCGLFWSTLRSRTSSLLPSLIAHLIWDMAIVSHPLVR